MWRGRALGAHPHACPLEPFRPQLFSLPSSRAGTPPSPQPPTQALAESAASAQRPAGLAVRRGRKQQWPRKLSVQGLPGGWHHRKRKQAGSAVRSGFLPQNRLKVMRFGFALCELAKRRMRRPQLSHVGPCRIWLTRWSRTTWAHLLTTSPPCPPAAFSTRRQGCVPRDPCSGKRAFLQPLQSERCAHARARLQQWDKLLLLSRFSCV